MEYNEQLNAHLATLVSAHGVQCNLRSGQVFIPRTNATMSLMVAQQ